MDEKRKNDDFAPGDALYNLLDLLQQHSENIMRLNHQQVTNRLSGSDDSIKDRNDKVFANALTNSEKLFNLTVEQLRLVVGVRSEAQDEVRRWQKWENDPLSRFRSGPYLGPFGR